jgi:hypothetical protein
MDQRTFRRHRRIEKAHTSHCWKCGRPKRDGCLYSGCFEVQHCACFITDGGVKQ